MNKQISFEGIGGDVATFWAASGVKPDEVVKLSADSTVAPCAAGERFCGVAVNAREGVSAVQFGGFVRLKCSDATVTPGFVTLTADGSGGVKKASTASDSTDKGQEYLVVAAESGSLTVRL